MALQNKSIYVAPDYEALRYTEPKAGMDKYYLSYIATEDFLKTSKSKNLFDETIDYILNDIKKDDPIIIKGDYDSNRFYIIHNNRKIGRLSSKSNIIERARANNVYNLTDFYVSNVFLWTYEDTIKSDILNGTDFAKKWTTKAKDLGYLYVIQIAGFGTKI